MCKVLCRPGGTAVGGSVDLGMKVSARSYENINLEIYYPNHQERVSCAVNVGYIMLANICKLNNQGETEKNHTDPELPQEIDTRGWTTTMESMEEYIHQFHGVNGASLSYTVRKDLNPVCEADDPSTM